MVETTLGSRTKVNQNVEPTNFREYVNALHAQKQTFGEAKEQESSKKRDKKATDKNSWQNRVGIQFYVNDQPETMSSLLESLVILEHENEWLFYESKVEFCLVDTD